MSEDTPGDADAPADADADTPVDVDADTFGVAVQVTEEELRFVVQVPSDIASGWRDPEEFQALVERVVWERLDREDTLRAVARTADPGETVGLGRVTLQPDGTVVETDLAAPEGPSGA